MTLGQTRTLLEHNMSPKNTATEHIIEAQQAEKIAERPEHGDDFRYFDPNDSFQNFVCYVRSHKGDSIRKVCLAWVAE